MIPITKLSTYKKADIINQMLYTATGKSLPDKSDFVVMTAEDIMLLYDMILIDVCAFINTTKNIDSDILQESGYAILDALIQKYSIPYEKVKV